MSGSGVFPSVAELRPAVSSAASKHAPTPDTLKGKVAVVTGGNRGIGRAIVTALARAGAQVTLVSRQRAAGERIAAELAGEGLRVDVGGADVTDASSVAALAHDVVQRHGHVDILVNNAGILLDEDSEGRASALSLDVLARTLAVNLYGPVLTSTIFVPHLARGGRIIMVSSGAGQLEGESSGWAPAYSTSKTALNAYTQSLAADLRDRDIMVDSFDPGWVRTDMGGPKAPRSPEEAASTALFLATRAPSKQTGLFWKDSKRAAW
jgi:NAD(P)-dependent dehydrogenase (short-subunit alcohol dehydrogenase family)